MYTLALDTTGYKARIALIKNGVAIFDREWRSHMNEEETVTKTIQNIMELEPFFLQKLDKIIINNGPGSLTATRVGVTIANALSYATGASLLPVDSFTVWSHRLSTEQKKQKPLQILRITEKLIFVNGKQIDFEKFMKTIEKTKKKDTVAYGELTPGQFSVVNRIKHIHWIIEPDMMSFGAALAGITAKGAKTYILPKYAYAPIITPAKKKLIVIGKKPKGARGRPKSGTSKKGAKAKTKKR